MHGQQNIKYVKTLKVEVLFYPMILDCRERTAIWKVPRLLQFVLLVKETCKLGQARSTDGSEVPKPVPVPFCPPHISQTALGSNPDLRCGTLAASRLTHSTALNDESNLNYI
jgi:hypothetical protein